MRLFKTVGLLGMCLGLAALVAWTTGCSSSEQPAPAADQGASATTAPAVEAADEEIAEDDEATIKASLASLSPEDRELAMKQKTCPVSGEPLGLMGAPIKVDVQGHTVFICCPGCKEDLLADADAYLVKLGMKPAAQ